MSQNSASKNADLSICPEPRRSALPERADSVGFEKHGGEQELDDEARKLEWCGMTVVFTIVIIVHQARRILQAVIMPTKSAWEK